jgi:hypothetical protein
MNLQKNIFITDDKENYYNNINQKRPKTIVNVGKNGLKKVTFDDEVKKLSDPVLTSQTVEKVEINSPEKDKNNKLDKKILIQKENSPKIQIVKSLKKNINELTYYLDRENSLLLKQYGADVYEYSKEIEIDNIAENFILRHKIVPEIRTKMVDWMIEVLSVYKSEIETFYLSVFIMDKFISLSPTILKTDDIHLIGITSMFIASKFEDIMPIRMNSIVHKIGHSQFTE